MEHDRAASIMLLAAELHALTVAVFAETQGMMQANNERRNNGVGDAYDSDAFIKLRDGLMRDSNYIIERQRNL